MFDGQMLLQLWIGEQRPSPVGSDVMNALVGVEVNVQDAGATGFQLTFTLGQSSPLRTSPLQTLFVLNSDGKPFVFTRVVIAVSVRNNNWDVLVDGVVTNLQITPGAGVGGQLVVTGEDLTFLMGIVVRTGAEHPAKNIPTRVRETLGRGEYARLGITAQVIDKQIPEYTPSQDADIPVQQGTDLEYLQQLAQKLGQVFYLIPGQTPANSIAYWGPLQRGGTPQPALTVNMGPHTNVESLNFRFDLQKNRRIEISARGEQTERSKAVTLGTPADPREALGKFRPSLVTFGAEGDSSVDKTVPTAPTSPSFSQTLAKREAEARANANADALEGSGSLNVLHYGQVLQSRRLVGVRGASEIFDGEYYVKSVTHSIKRGEYKQNFQLSRNAFIAKNNTVTV
jgi:hypothetical protein